MNAYESLTLDLVFLAGGAALLVAGLFAFRSFVEIVPVTRAQRDTLRRTVPVLTALLALIYCVVTVRVLLATEPAFAAAGTALVLVGFVVLAFGPMRDVVSGVVLKAGRVCQQGDHVRLDDLHGRITSMGLRVLVLETNEGEEAVIPYSRVARERVLRTAGVESVSPHVFRVRLPTTLTLSATKTLIRQRAMLVHFSAVSRLPEVSVSGETVEVTVYTLDADHGPDIEAEVRKALGTVDPPTTPSSNKLMGTGAQQDSTASPRWARDKSQGKN